MILSSHCDLHEEENVSYMKILMQRKCCEGIPVLNFYYAKQGKGSAVGVLIHPCIDAVPVHTKNDE